MAEWYAARIREAWDETRAMRGLRLELPEPARRSHERAGQYLKLRTSGGVEGFFALASPPGEEAELLVKRGGAVGDAVHALGSGAEVEVGAIEGKGYPVEESAGRDLLFVAAGSGIAPIRAALELARARRERYGRLSLYYGQREPLDFAYRARGPAWRDAGIEVAQVASRAEDTGWAGPTGHVQDALRASSPPVENTVVFLCGMKGMVEGVSAALAALGLPKDRLHLNY